MTWFITPSIGEQLGCGFCCSCRGACWHVGPHTSCRTMTAQSSFAPPPTVVTTMDAGFGFGRSRCMDDTRHCYCIDLPPEGERTKPHDKCCKCGDTFQR